MKLLVFIFCLFPLHLTHAQNTPLIINSDILSSRAVLDLSPELQQFVADNSEKILAQAEKDAKLSIQRSVKKLLAEREIVGAIDRVKNNITSIHPLNGLEGEKLENYKQRVNSNIAALRAKGFSIDLPSELLSGEGFACYFEGDSACYVKLGQVRVSKPSSNLNYILGLFSNPTAASNCIIESYLQFDAAFVISAGTKFYEGVIVPHIVQGHHAVCSGLFREIFIQAK